MAHEEFISHNDLLDAIESDPSDNHFKTAAQFLMRAITDWPTPNLQEPKDFIGQLKNEINQKLTLENLREYYKTLAPKTGAWKLEALSSLYQVFDLSTKDNLDKAATLDEIIVRLTQHYRRMKFE